MDDPDVNIRIIDYALSEIQADGEVLHKKVSTIYYRAPEIMLLLEDGWKAEINMYSLA